MPDDDNDSDSRSRDVYVRVRQGKELCHVVFTRMQYRYEYIRYVNTVILYFFYLTGGGGYGLVVAFFLVAVGCWLLVGRYCTRFRTFGARSPTKNENTTINFDDSSDRKGVEERGRLLPDRYGTLRSDTSSSRKRVISYWNPICQGLERSSEKR
jgi:hypothetical protein